jgi:hypothetical protein
MSRPVFHLEPMGRLANLMIQYMVAMKFATMVDDCRISNIAIPAWGIDHPLIDPSGGNEIEIANKEQHINLSGLADQVRQGEISRVAWTGFGQRMENFLPPDLYQDVFASPFPDRMGYGADFLVCPVRAEDILDASNPDYVLTPVEFYRDIVDLTGLTPVFIGQTRPNAYMGRIRNAFPDAIFREPQDNPLVDFETIRQSRHLAIGVSTYSWLAAWLSRSAETIYLPVNGLFNPMQKQDVDLLPFGDHRYRFFLFPINYAVPLERHAEAHRRIAPYWREMPHAALRQQFDAAPRFARDLNQALAVFDNDFYLNKNADVAERARTFGPAFGRAHYILWGFQEGRLPLRFDPEWYASEYPMAAFEVAQGDSANLPDHYIAIGKARGYRPHKPDRDG